MKNIVNIRNAPGAYAAKFVEGMNPEKFLAKADMMKSSIAMSINLMSWGNCDGDIKDLQNRSFQCT